MLPLVFPWCFLTASFFPWETNPKFCIHPQSFLSPPLRVFKPLTEFLFLLSCFGVLVMHGWIRGLFSIMAFLALFLLGEERNKDMSFAVGHELWLVLGRCVSTSRNPPAFPESPAPGGSWIPCLISQLHLMSLIKTRIKFKTSWGCCPLSLGWRFWFILLKISCLHCWTEQCAGNLGKGRALHPPECKMGITASSQLQGCNKSDIKLNERIISSQDFQDP